MPSFTKNEFDPKKKTLHANEAETERVQNLRREYWTTIGEVSLKDLVFIDETGINLAWLVYSLLLLRSTQLKIAIMSDFLLTFTLE